MQYMEPFLYGSMFVRFAMWAECILIFQVNLILNNCEGGTNMEKERICVGVVGAGAISDIYLKNMTSRFENLYVKAVCARHFESAEAKARKYGIAAVTYEEMLQDEEIGIIVNLTPAYAHYEVIKKALLCGKHVYTEKTMTDDIDKTRELVALAKAKGLYLGAAPDTFLGAALQAARSAVDDGLIGEINSFAISGNRNNDILLSAFAFLREPGGGIVFDYAVYYVTALVSILGPVSRVGSIIRAPYLTHVNCIPQNPLYGQTMKTPNESQVNAVIQMESGVTGTLHIDADSIMADQTWFMIYGTKGILMLTNPDHFEGQVKFIPESMDFDHTADPIILCNFTPYTDNARGIGVSDMADAIMNKRACRADMDMAYHVQEILTAILKGGNSGEFMNVISTCEKPELLVPAKIPVTKLAHVSYNAKNMDDMLKFYEAILGMKRLFTLKIRDLYDTIKSHWIGQEEEGYIPSDDERAYAASLEGILDENWIVYLKLSNRQYIELFYDIDGFGAHKDETSKRGSSYGYKKMNFEVDDIQKIRKTLVEGGVMIQEDVHETVYGSRELVIYDPDGNEVQFVEYSQKEAENLGININANSGSCSQVNFITQVAYEVKDNVNMLNYYTKGLNFRHAGRLTYNDLANAMECGGVPDEAVGKVRKEGNNPWIDYIEVAPHQYIELFYSYDEQKTMTENIGTSYGYQHISLEVSDIKEAWDAVIANGLKPDSEITLGCDGAYQFWMTDPDGNRMEFHCYTDKSKQLL